MTLVLMDAPEEGYCENFGWVEANVPIPKAAKLLSECCLDEGGVAGYVPQGRPNRVWLRSNGRDDEGERAQLEDAVYRALEAGMTQDEVREEINYAIESHEDD